MVTTSKPPFTTRRHAATRRHRATVAVAATFATALLATCGTHGSMTSTAAPSTSSATVELAAPTTSSTAAAFAVRSDHDLPVYASPADATPVRVLPAHDTFGSPLVLLVSDAETEPAGGWFQILVPGRPNGVTGWVRSAEVTVNEVADEVRVDLANRMLTVVRNDQVVLTTPVAVGDPDHPTPTGRFSITDKIDTGEPDGPYGPYALGLSARSDVLTEFAGGDGQIGIHGTDDPSSIGRPVSHGCIRVPNDMARQLNDLLSLGTPVVVS